MSKAPESAVSPPLAGSGLVKMTPESQSMPPPPTFSHTHRGVGEGGEEARDPYKDVGFDLRLPSRAQLSCLLQINC